MQEIEKNPEQFPRNKTLVLICRTGRRSLKYMDYGIMAATFLNMETSRAFRVLSTEVARDLTCVYAPAQEITWPGMDGSP